MRQDADDSGYQSYALEAEMLAFHAASGTLYTRDDDRALFARYGVPLDGAAILPLGSA